MNDLDPSLFISPKTIQKGYVQKRKKIDKEKIKKSHDGFMRFVARMVKDEE